ncbi:hypothetical protein M404DRAFT_33258 [Pisolithus tinctorius Marx 270]|uniref:Transmembrane protein n=1 Tax=Pisolithus tinctorius Marx 270 TaxID=870435 RepID=A0A0C3JFR0_PISTI|nr:hypothetical protein M404DRAFT_33258 [Pisolithus tinctorius Marx 270]
MIAAKRVLALNNGLWKSRKVDSSCAQPPQASDSRTPRCSYSFCFFCGLSGHIRAAALFYLQDWKSRAKLPDGLYETVSTTGLPAPSRSVFDTPSCIPAQMSITHTQSLPTVQLKPAVPNPPAIPSRRSSADQGGHMAEANRPHLVVHVRAHRVERVHTCVRVLTPFFLVLVLTLALSFTFEEGIFIHPSQAEAIAQPQSRAPALSKSALMLRVA